jgi:hypothetical protein
MTARRVKVWMEMMAAQKFPTGKSFPFSIAVIL